IAKAATSFDPAADRTMALGKKHYMSPEQMLALDIDGRSDVFAVGLVLYELLTLQPVFTEDVTELAIDEVTLKPIPNVRSHAPSVPPEIDRIIAMALEREPSRRPTAGTMGKALDRWCEAQPIVATPDRLQEHLAMLFPTTYQPASHKAEFTKFSNFRRGLRGRRPMRKLFSRLLGR
ncbi:MAG TPA: protein kinase, partial [Gemmatimonadaceae bacterium]|nr:protein kinase [Gemmatimonadaceae bacterium]